MKTWAKQLEDALPNALKEVLDTIMDEYCPYNVFADEFAPEYLSSEPCDGELCELCWDSCDSKCRYRGEQDDAKRTD